VVSLCSVYLKKTEYITSTFDIFHSIFDIRFFRVSFSIKLAAFQARDWADIKHPVLRLRMKSLLENLAEEGQKVIEYR
jgi:hypothetical protein